MSLQVLIGGVDRTAVIDLDTLEVEDAVGERSVARFTVSDIDGSLGSVLARGTSVSIVHDGTCVFGGTIDLTKRTRALEGCTGLIRRVECVDWHQLADRRIVAESYSGTTCGAVVRDILAKYLAADGITEGTPSTIQDGASVQEAVFNYVPASRCLDVLAERAGFAWWIDPSKILHFVERSTYTAPWMLDSSARFGGLEVTEHRQGYRNRQYIRAGKDLTDLQTETFKGDGSRRTFTLGYPLAQVPTITLNGGAQTVGIKGIDSGRDWYWNKGDPILTQDSAGTPLTVSDTLAVSYRGWFDVVVLVTDDAQIETRKAVEGGTGYYDAAEDQTDLSSAIAAIQAGSAKLRRYARFTEQISFETWDAGLRPGQILTVNVPILGLSSGFLIEETTFRRFMDDQWAWSVKAVSGDAVGGWPRFFRDMATRGQAWVIRENIREEEVLVVLVTASEP